jgi:hypothetical protein
MRLNPFEDFVPPWILFVLSFVAAILITAFLLWLWQVTG